MCIANNAEDKHEAGELRLFWILRVSSSLEDKNLGEPPEARLSRRGDTTGNKSTLDSGCRAGMTNVGPG